MQELVLIQARLNAPKNRYNKFGGYAYRSCEDILEALKPLLSEQGCVLTLDDDIVELAGRVYVRATATLTNSAGAVVATHAFAREEEVKKGMDSSQITGAASSYARKYALNGLFAIDDTKDADATNTHGRDGKSAKTQTAADDMVGGVPFADIEAAVMCCNNIAELTAFYKEHMEWKDDARVMALFTRRKKELNGNR